MWSISIPSSVLNVKITVAAQPELPDNKRLNNNATAANSQITVLKAQQGILIQMLMLINKFMFFRKAGEAGSPGEDGTNGQDGTPGESGIPPKSDYGGESCISVI